MREITDKEFFELSKTDSVKVFDFWAPWCGQTSNSTKLM